MKTQGKYQSANIFAILPKRKSVVLLIFSISFLLIFLLLNHENYENNSNDNVGSEEKKGDDLSSRRIFSTVNDKRNAELAITKWDNRIKELMGLKKPFKLPINIDSRNYIHEDFVYRYGVRWDSNSNHNWVDQPLYESSVGVVYVGGSKTICEKLSQIDEMPSSDIQIIAAIAVYRSLEEFSKIKDSAELTPWLQLARSKHAVFRLLAVEASAYVSVNGVHYFEEPTTEEFTTDSLAKFELYKITIADGTDQVRINTVQKLKYCATYLVQAKVLLKELTADSNIEISNSAKKILAEIRTAETSEK